jgi:hypothetical protein
MRPDLYYIPRDVPLHAKAYAPPASLSIDLAHDHYPAPPERRHIDLGKFAAGVLAWISLFGASFVYAATRGAP